MVQRMSPTARNTETPELELQPETRRPSAVADGGKPLVPRLNRPECLNVDYDRLNREPRYRDPGSDPPGN